MDLCTLNGQWILVVTLALLIGVPSLAIGWAELLRAIKMMRAGKIKDPIDRGGADA